MKNIAKIGLLVMVLISFGLMFSSSWDDALTFDENSHIAAGYSYLTERDMRANPEHPPIIKDLAALPLLFFDLAYEKGPSWDVELNPQWSQGDLFMFGLGNNPDTIMRASRTPIMLLSILTALFLFGWARRMYGNKIALLATFLYLFSPTVLAHSRYVTTDVAAMFAFLVGIAAYLHFLKHQNIRWLIITGLVFGVAQLFKFSLFLLVPIYGVLGFVWLFTADEYWSGYYPKSERIKKFLKDLLILAGKTLSIFIIGGLLVWVVYIFHVWDYPQEQQQHNAAELLDTFSVPQLVDLDLWLIDHKLTRPLGHYLTGLMMVSQRTAGGNSAYFLGEVSAEGWVHYFPTAYLLKETLPFHILTLLALALGLSRLRRRKKSWEALRGWTQDNFALFAGLFFIVFYWALTIINPLNIGIRHLMPIFPFVFLLVARQLIIWISGTPLSTANSFREKLFIAWQNITSPIPKAAFILLMLVWIFGAAITTFPFYLSYYNELVGGTENGYLYITDSNYDWGQDLKRLVHKMDTEFIGEKVHLSYFGGGAPPQPQYYLGDRYVEWWSSRGAPPSGSLFAISTNNLQGSISEHIPPLTIAEQDTYSWLEGLEHFDRAGSSILLYRMP